MSRARQPRSATPRAPLVQAATARLRLDAYLPYRLSVASHSVSSLIADAYERRFHLPIPQWRVLSILNDHGQLRQQDIVPLSTMDKQTVSRAVRALLARGLLSRRAHSEDGRAWSLRLSAAGRQLYSRVVPLALRYEQELLRDFSADERDALLRALQRLQGTAELRLAAKDGSAP